MSGMSRRGFLGGALAGLAATRMREARAEDAPEPDAPAPPEPASAPEAAEQVDVTFTCNGEQTKLRVGGELSALAALRAQGLTGAKLGCGAGTCGACTVVVDSVPQVTCLLPATSLHRARVETVEALSQGTDVADMHPVQRAFLAHDALQCPSANWERLGEAAHLKEWCANGGSVRRCRVRWCAALFAHRTPPFATVPPCAGS